MPVGDILSEKPFHDVRVHDPTPMLFDDHMPKLSKRISIRSNSHAIWTDPVVLLAIKRLSSITLSADRKLFRF